MAWPRIWSKGLSKRDTYLPNVIHEMIIGQYSLGNKLVPMSNGVHVHDNVNIIQISSVMLYI